MCGFVGVLSIGDSGSFISPDLIETMRDTMFHRGPDGSGVWMSPDSKVGLGHRRLSIQDLSDLASQPMSSISNDICLVFNGEIYNHVALRRQLISYGVSDWVTDHSDTEVVLKAYEYWGTEFVNYLDGMFSIGIWDSRSNKLILARDRVGEKPLYYCVLEDKILFASEIKALLADSSVTRAVNEEALYHYLSFLTTPAPLTLFKGIYKLEASTLLTFHKDGTYSSIKYWDPLDHTYSLSNHTESEIAAQLLNELKSSVHGRMVGDVPVGVFLSGGIDSSTNAALFSNDCNSAVKTFSIGYNGEFGSYENELVFAKQVANFVNGEYHEQLLTCKDLKNFMSQMVRLQDEPIADPVCFPVYFVSKLARDNGVKVCQVGEGADELFCGYPGWRTSLKLQALNKIIPFKFPKICVLFVLKTLGKEKTFYYEWLRRGISGESIFWGGAEAFTETHKRLLLSSNTKERLGSISSWDVISKIKKRYDAKVRTPSDLNWMTYLDLSFRLPELLLMRVDKMSMGASLETRVPFLAHRLVELALSIPQDLKLKGNELKYILKKAVRGTIPDQIIDRPKQGFGVPLHDWFMEELKDDIRFAFEDLCKNTDFFNRDELIKLIDEGKSAQAWYIYNFALWWKEYIKR